MRNVYLTGVLLLCTACGHTSGVQSDELQYKRIEYFETVFQPASQACDRAGGFMIFEDPTGSSASLSYTDMRMAVMRGCAGT